jgi:hypothetical protein
MVNVQKVLAPVICHQNISARIAFSNQQILNGEHRDFLETFQLIFEADQGAHHLILIHKIQEDHQTFYFPVIAYEFYQPKLISYPIERCSGFPNRPFYPVFGTNEEFDYWRELLNWDGPLGDDIL